MEQKKTVPSVYSCSDFRIYLKDYYEARNKYDPDFTKSFICRKLGLPISRSYFQDVLNGKTVSDIKIPLFTKLLELDKDEARF
ncbi:MAG: TIGR02147 family protein, partial [Crenarchaeota archaeon]|nr:TIGR02147 family protein [Thermoproteota archaeon]